VASVISSFSDVSRVFVTETSVGGRGVAHSLQYLESAGLSVRQLGHWTAIDVPIFLIGKEYQENGDGVNAYPASASLASVRFIY
jgi:hypothetical protein